ncbi:hypothetical protein WJ04_01370 [Burkholderia vietnamiensis]|nr:hypothetical protein WJ04_01370 [Burkholderia vietnamiensis]
MGAMLRAQYELLQLVISQLRSIEATLAELQSQIDRLPDQFRQIVADQYASTKVVELLSSVQTYQTLLRASQRDSTVWSSPSTQFALQDLLYTARSRRAALSLVPEGLGPFPVAAAALGCAFETAASLRLSIPTSVVRETLNDYHTWITSMLGSSPGSIRMYEQSAIDRHNGIVDQLQQTRLGQAMGISNFRLPGNQHATVAIDSCYWITENHYQTPPNPTYRALPQPGWALLESLYYRTGQITATQDATVGAVLLSYSPGLGGAYVRQLRSNPNSSVGKPIPIAATCKVFVSTNHPYALDDYIRFAEQDTFQGAYATERAQMVAGLSRINVERARISYAQSARIIALQSAAQINETLKLY